MQRLTWKLAGGLFPFIATLMLCNGDHPYRTTTFIGLGIIWANAFGFVEGHMRKLK